MPRIKHALWLLCAWIGSASAQGTPAAAPFAWSVTAANSTEAAAADKRIAPVQHILIGSVHLLPASAYPLPAGLQSAYQQTRGLVLETDPSGLQEPALQKRVLKASRMPKGQSLSQLIEPAVYQQVRERAVQLDLSARHCDHFRAWFCALSLELQGLHDEGLDSSNGIDRHFFNRAMRDDRSVRWLEQPADQIALFTDMGDELGAQFLIAALRGLADPAGKPAELLRQWREDDRAKMQSSVEEMKRDYPAIYQRILGARNQAWMAPLEAFLREPEAQLIVVGAAHLVGPEGLPSLLAARGWKVEALTAPPPADAANAEPQ